MGVHPQALHELLSCVLDSAVQRTPRGGQVQVHATEQDGRVKVVVDDTGREVAQRLNEMLHSEPSCNSQVSTPWQTPPGCEWRLSCYMQVTADFTVLLYCRPQMD